MHLLYNAKISKMLLMKHNELQNYISHRIRECRKERKLSQEKLSESAGLGMKAIQNMENSKYDFKIQTLEKVIAALNISVEDFFQFQYRDSSISIDTLNKNISSLPIDKQQSIIMSFNEIVKNLE